MASALIESKRVASGIEATARIPEAFLIIAGDGPLRQELKTLANELLPARHEFLGSVPMPDMPNLYRRADAFLHTSQDEPFGIVYLEAAACGLPVVADDNPTVRWILGETARYAPTQDPVAVAVQLRDVLQPAVAKQLSVAACQRVQKDWTWRIQADKYREFLFECAARKTGMVNP